VSTIIDELVLKFGLDNSQFVKNAKNTNEQMVKTKNEAKKTATDLEAYGKRGAQFFGQMQRAAVEFFAVLAGATGITQLITGVIQLESRLGKLSNQTGQSTEDLQAWGNIAELVGGKSQEMQAGMSGISQALVNLKYRGEMSPLLMFFSQLGVQITDATTQTELMIDLAARAEKMKKSDFFGLASSAGMNESMITVLMQGKDAVSKMFAEQQRASLVTKEQAEKARQLEKEMTQLRQTFDSMTRDFVNSIIPSLQWFLRELQGAFNWMRDNQATVEAFFIGVGSIMAAYFIPPMIAAVVAMLPLIAAVGLLAGGLATLWQDYQVWRRGGKSIIDWAAWGKELTAAYNAVNDLASSILKLFGLTGGKDSFISMFRGIGSVIAQEFRELINMITNVADALNYLSQGEYLKAIASLISTDSRENIAKGIIDKSKVSATFGIVDSLQRVGDAFFNGLSSEQKDVAAPKTAMSAPKGTEAQKLKSLEQQYGLPAGLLDSVYLQESSRGRNAGKSSAGAEGPFQLMPATAKAYGVTNPYDFDQSADAAARMFRDLLKQYNGNVYMALAAYNWGSGNLQRKGLANAPSETKNYMREVVGRLGGSTMSPQFLGSNAAAQANIARPQAASGGNITTVENNIANLVIQTQATDAKDIAGALPLALQQSLNGAGAVYSFDTGVQP
jgi:hypothetical protein